MKIIMKMLPILMPLTFLVGCGTVANVKTTDLNIHNQAFKNKTVYISDSYRQVYWKDLSAHMIGTKPQSGETLEKKYDINKKISGDKGDLFVSFEKQRKTIPMLKMLKPKLEKAIRQANGKVSEDKNTADYLLLATITIGPTPSPAYADRNMGESMGKRLMTLGLVPTGYFTVRNDYKLALSLKNTQGKILSKKEYIVNNSVQQSVSDLSFSQVETNTATAMKLFENSLNQKISDFISSMQQNKFK